jgi:hypothetical protein
MSTTLNGFDLGSTKGVEEREEDGQVIELHDAELEPLLYGSQKRPVTMTIVGSYSPTYKRAEESQLSKTLRRRGQVLTGPELKAQRTELLAACVKAWDGFFEDGNPVPCERSFVLDVLRKAPWIREQVERAVDDHAGFSKVSSSAS